MNTPASREGNFIRYIVYLAGYLLAAVSVKLVLSNKKVHVWDFILFVIVAAMILLFFIYRFNREQRFFKKTRSLSIVSDMGYTIGLTILITAIRIFAMYFQTTYHLGLAGFQIAYAKHESTNMFWFLMLAEGIVLPVLQVFLADGFLFNYAFRKSSTSTAVVGVIVSGLIFSLTSFQYTPLLFLVNWGLGAIFAWSYLYLESIWMPIYLAVLSGLLMIVMI